MSAAGRLGRWRGPIAFGLGAALLAAALWMVAGQRDVLSEAWSATRRSPAWLIVAAVVLPMANYVVISASFWVQMRRLGPVGMGEMSALIGAAWLLNFVPMRVGMVGRIAYHKVWHGIGVARSIEVMAVGMGMGAVSVVLALAIAAAMPTGASALAWAVALCAPLPMLLGLSWVLRGAGVVGARATLHPSTMAMVLALRWVDIVLWMLRYAVVFELVGRPISLGGAAALAAVSQVALNVPLAGNGLGLREWAVGLTAGWLPRDVMGVSGGLTTAVGLAADLVNRAAEIVVAVPVGLVSLGLLARRRMRRGEPGRPGASEGRPGRGEGPMGRGKPADS